MKNHKAYPEKGFLTKSISKSYGRSMAMPPAWELNLISMSNIMCRVVKNIKKVLCIIFILYFASSTKVHLTPTLTDGLCKDQSP